MTHTAHTPIEIYDTGADIVLEGQHCASMYVLVSGAVALKKKGRIIRIVDTPNDFFGELFFLVGEPAAFSAAAIRPSKLLRIEEPDFDRIIQTNGKFALKIIKVLSERFRDKTGE
jgi:CRP-like cAMP-binding protein